MNRIKTVILTALAAMLPLAAQAQNFSVSTNAVDYACLGTVNLDASYAPGTHWTIGAGVKYNSYTIRQRAVSLNARYWPWHKYSGWWIAGSMKYQEYNTGGYRTFRFDAGEETSEGDRVGGGLAAGYSYMLGNHFNLDFGLGLWAGYDIYRTYVCPKCGAVSKTGQKFFVLPSDFTIGVAYLF